MFVGINLVLGGKMKIKSCPNCGNREYDGSCCEYCGTGKKKINPNPDKKVEETTFPESVIGIVGALIFIGILSFLSYYAKNPDMFSEKLDNGSWIEQDVNECEYVYQDGKKRFTVITRTKSKQRAGDEHTIKSNCIPEDSLNFYEEQARNQFRLMYNQHTTK